MLCITLWLIVIIHNNYINYFFKKLQLIAKMVNMKRMAKEVDNLIQMAVDYFKIDPSGAVLGRRHMILQTIDRDRLYISNKTTTPINLQEAYKEKMRLNFSTQELIRKRKLYNIND